MPVGRGYDEEAKIHDNSRRVIGIADRHGEPTGSAPVVFSGVIYFNKQNYDHC